MPSLTLNIDCTIDCTYEQACNIISMLANKSATGNLEIPAAQQPVTKASDNPEEIATKFAKYIKEAADAGSPGQLNTMTAWLEADGKARLKDLVKASGAKHQQGYSGVGGSLSKNMIKAGGPRKRSDGIPQYPQEWYGFVRDLPKADGEYTYVIAEELIEPLKHAFKAVQVGTPRV